MFPSHINRAHDIPITLVPTTGTVKVPAVTTFRVIVRRRHCLTTLTAPRAKPARPPRIHRLHADIQKGGLVLDEIEQLATSPRRDAPGGLARHVAVFELAKRLEDDRFAVVSDGQPYQFVCDVVLDLRAETAFSAPRSARW